MSTHRRLDAVCAAALALSLILTVLFMGGEVLGIEAADRNMGYEGRLFDTSYVHTIDIVMEDWDSFIETCRNEEYANCSVVIDGEVYGNVGIRAKGNTSLSNVASMDSDRYSFKVEFDQYDGGMSYHGLDKLSLNNVIQDATYMKDYLTYRLMGDFGVNAPLCSYAFITVNGEDWGLYLAVEGVEDSYLRRNYGASHGELYKPDSMDFGGGRGNGRDFDMEDFFSALQEEGGEARTVFAPEEVMTEGLGPDEFVPPGGMGAPGQGGRGGFDPGSTGGRGGFGGMGSSDVKLQYTGDDEADYSNIFNNAKTDLTQADKERLIAALKALGDGGDIEGAVDVEQVIRYFVVHNFVCNGDSYTGSMVHNYYLYEEEGRLSMIPWDYNLAFGTFQSSSATDTVNAPIDTPVSGSDDRPMVDWIFDSAEYTELYHEYFGEFLQSVDFAAAIDSAAAMIAPYVERDPSKFYSYDEFELGVETLKEFCLLREQSAQGQLAGVIPSTEAGQAADSSALIDASHIAISDMGSMGMGGGMDAGGRGQRPGSGQGFARPGTAGAEEAGDPGAAAGGAETGLPPQPRGAGATEAMPQPPGMQPGGMGGELPPGAGGMEPSGQAQPAWPLLAASAAALLIGLLAAFRFKRRRA